MRNLVRTIAWFSIVTLTACGGSTEQVKEEAPAPPIQEEPAPVVEETGPKPIECADFEKMSTLDPHSEAVAEALKKQAAITWDAKVSVNNEAGTCAAVEVKWGEGEEFDYAGYLKENDYEFKKRLPWILNLLNQTVPESKIRMTKAEATAKDGTGYLFSVDTSLTDGEILPGKTRAIKTDLRQAVTKLEEHSLSNDIPIDSATVCLDLQALALELDLGNTNLVNPIKLRTARTTLDEIEIPDFEHIRRGSVTLMDSAGRIIQERAFSHPGVVSTQKGACGCDLLIAVAQGVTQQKATHEFDEMTNKDSEKVKWIQAQLSRPGKPMDKIAELRNLPNDTDDLRVYTDLLELAFQQRSQVVHKVKKPSNIFLRLEGNNSSAASKSALTKSLSKIGKLNEGEITETVCLQDSKDQTITTFGLDAVQSELFTGALTGIEKLESVVVLDIGAAGLGPKDSGFLIIDMAEKERVALTSLLRKRSTLIMKAALGKKTREDRTAVVTLPVERVSVGTDGSVKKSTEKLRVKAELGAALAIEEDDQVTLQGHGFTINLPLLQFFNPGETIKALTTPWGALKTLDVPLRSLSILNNPVEVLYEPGFKNLRIIAQDDVGRAIGEAGTTMAFPLRAHRPLLGGCTLVIKSPAVPAENTAQITDLNPWESKAVKDYVVVNADRQSVHYHFVRSTGCAPTASKGAAHALVVNNQGITPLQCP